MTQVILVDAEDNELGTKDRALLGPDDTHRAAELWLINNQGELLLSQRSFAKKYNAGKWGATVGGTIEPGETYESNIIKEAKEELGLILSSFTIGPKIFRTHSRPNYYCQIFFATQNISLDQLILHPDEVIGARWLSLADVAKALETNDDSFTLHHLSTVFPSLQLFASQNFPK